jgi:3-dehydroquinate synthase
MATSTIIYTNKIQDELLQRLSNKTILILDQGLPQEFREVFSSHSLVWTLPGGEEVKNFSTLSKLSEEILEHNISRHYQVIAVGGGAVLDLAGFLSSILLRGLSWTAVPSTLLAMVDAGIGGKTAINSTHGKNLIGSFHHPLEILMDISFLESLKESEIKSGKGEILKLCLLYQGIAEQVLNQDPLEKLIYSCVQFKEDIVAKDFKEQGLRKVLNLGHNFAHAWEQFIKKPHGELVAQGVYWEDYFLNNKINEKLVLQLASILKIDTIQEKPVFSDEFFQAIQKDKKNNQKQLEFILTKEFRPTFINLTLEELRQTLA